MRGGGKKMAPSRLDRAPGHRPAFEAARKKILATQDICGICGKPVDKTLKSPHPMSATVDHIIPLDKGGHPSDLSNLQLAHRSCNRQKSNKLVKEVYAQDEEEKLVSNRILEQHNDWKNYKAK